MPTNVLAPIQKRGRQNNNDNDILAHLQNIDAALDAHEAPEEQATPLSLKAQAILNQSWWEIRYFAARDIKVS